MRDIASPPNPSSGMTFSSRYHVSSDSLTLGSPTPPSNPKPTSKTPRAVQQAHLVSRAAVNVVLESVGVNVIEGERGEGEGFVEDEVADDDEAILETEQGPLTVQDENLPRVQQLTASTSPLPSNPLSNLLSNLTFLRKGNLPALEDDSSDPTKKPEFLTLSRSSMSTQLTKSDLKSVQVLKLKLAWLKITSSVLIARRLKQVLEREKAVRKLQKYGSLHIFRLRRNDAADRIQRIWRLKSGLSRKIISANTLISYLSTSKLIKKWFLLSSRVIKAIKRLQRFWRGYLSCTLERIKILDMLWLVVERRLIMGRSQGLGGRLRGGDVESESESVDYMDDEGGKKTVKKRRRKKKKKRKSIKKNEEGEETHAGEERIYIVEPITELITPNLTYTSKTGISSWYTPSRTSLPASTYSVPFTTRLRFYKRLLKEFRRRGGGGFGVS